MTAESFLYFNYITKYYSSIYPMLNLLPLTYVTKKTSQKIELTSYAHPLGSFGNYVFVNPIEFSLEGVKFNVNYLSQSPEVFLSSLAESQKLTPIRYIDGDYIGFVFLNSWSCTKGNTDNMGTYSLSFTYYNIDIFNLEGQNDVQLGEVLTDEVSEAAKP